MTRRKSATLTDGELRLMRVLWDKGSASVSEVVASLSGRQRPAYNSVLTLLRILERKGYARHEKEGRAFVYYPVIDLDQARCSAIRRMVSRLFDGSSANLVMNVLKQEEVGSRELRRLKKLIADTK